MLLWAKLSEINTMRDEMRRYSTMQAMSDIIQELISRRDTRT